MCYIFCLLMILSPGMLAFHAPEKAGFSLVACSCLRCPEISLPESALRADGEGCRKNICIFVFYNADNLFFRHFLFCLYFYLAFDRITAINTPEIFSLFYKNAPALWTKLHFVLKKGILLNLCINSKEENLLGFYRKL